MKKKLKMKPIGKYTILFIIDLIFVFNLPLLLKDVETINDYRFNILVLGAFLTANVIALIKIEKEIGR